MGKLIDTDVLKQELYQQWFMDILLTQESREDMFYALAQKIDAQSTAYDPDKVVEQLGDYGNEEINYCRNTPYENCIKECINKAIEIVKGGGVDDKVI